MLRKEIDKKFTDIVSDMISKGYIIHSNTMSGTQGEIGKIDFTDGKKVYRLFMDTEHIKQKTEEGKTYYLDTIFIFLGHTENIPTGILNTIWNNELEQDIMLQYYKIDENYFVDNVEEAIHLITKQCERRGNRGYEKNHIELSLTPNILSVVLSRVHKLPKMKSVKKGDIRKVYKYYTEYNHSYRYCADVRKGYGNQTVGLW